jgi:hypothetical protein
VIWKGAVVCGCIPHEEEEEEEERLLCLRLKRCDVLMHVCAAHQPTTRQSTDPNAHVAFPLPPTPIDCLNIPHTHTYPVLLSLLTTGRERGDDGVEHLHVAAVLRSLPRLCALPDQARLQGPCCLCVLYCVFVSGVCWTSQTDPRSAPLLEFTHVSHPSITLFNERSPTTPSTSSASTPPSGSSPTAAPSRPAVRT